MARLMSCIETMADMPGALWQGGQERAIDDGEYGDPFADAQDRLYVDEEGVVWERN